MAKGNKQPPASRRISDDVDNNSSDDNEVENEEEFDLQKYRKFLARAFPSRYSARLAAQSTTDNNKNKKKKKSRKLDSSSSSENDEDDEDEYDEDECESNDVTVTKGKKSQFNIILTVGPKNRRLYEDEDDEEEYDEDYDEYDEDEYDDEDEEEVSDDDEEDSEEDESDQDEDDGISKRTRNKVTNEDENKCVSETVISKLRATLNDLTDKERKSSIGKSITKELEELEKQYKKDLKTRTKKIRSKNTKKFRTLLREPNVMNDIRYFKDNLTPDEQARAIQQISEIKKHCDVSKPYRMTLLDADIPVTYKACAYKKLSTLRYMESGSGEYYKVKQWVDAFMRIPFGKYKNLSLTIEDGVEKCHDFMADAKQTLDNVVYGLDDAKLQILQMVGQWIANPEAIGNAIAIQGPMGTGKTTLVKDGISKILGRDFAFFALGGATDSSVLEGHSYTYEGSMWGKIIDIVMQCGNMNPVIYFDELDKVSDTPKGEEIIGILTHLTDTSQNNKFHDKYFSEIDFDLSRCLFIFSYNDESRVNPILRDRMYRIQTKGYNEKDKTIIARDYQLPKIREQVKFSEEDITIPDETIQHIVSKFTEGEEGVRNLKRCLEIIYTKLNLYRLMKPGVNLFEKDLSLKVEFPLTVTNDIVDKLIKKSEDSGRWLNMYN